MSAIVRLAPSCERRRSRPSCNKRTPYWASGLRLRGVYQFRGKSRNAGSHQSGEMRARAAQTRSAGWAPTHAAETGAGTAQRGHKPFDGTVLATKAVMVDLVHGRWPWCCGSNAVVRR